LQERSTRPSVYSASNSPLQAPAWPLVLCFFLAAVAVFQWNYPGAFLLWWQDDVQVYARAVNDWLAGRDPYNASHWPLFFLYPPVFLFLSGFLSHLVPAGWGWNLFSALHIVAMCAIPLVLARFFFPQSWLSPQFALLLFFASPRFPAVLAFCEMNVAAILYLAALVGAVPGLRRNRWLGLYLAVFLAAMIKITFISLLLLPLLAGRRQWAKSALCATAVVAANLLQMALWPQLYSGYRWSLVQGVLVQRNFGYGVFGIFAEYGRKLHLGAQSIPYLLSILLAATLVAFLVRLRFRLQESNSFGPAGRLNHHEIWIALVVVTTILVNPREMQYDMDIAIFVAFVLLVYGLRARRLLWLMAALFVPALLVPLLIHSPRLYGMYDTLLTLAGFGLAYRRLWREAGVSQMAFDAVSAAD